MADGTTDNRTVADLLEDFYRAIEIYEGDLNDLRIVQTGLDNPRYSEQEQVDWRSRIRFNEEQLQRSVDQLRLVTNAIRVVAGSVHQPCDALDTLGNLLHYKPYHTIPPQLPTDEQVIYAIDDAEVVLAAVAMPPSIRSQTRNAAAEQTGESKVLDSAEDVLPASKEQVDNHEEYNQDDVALLTPKMFHILSAMHSLGAVASEHRRTQAKIIKEYFKTADGCGYKREFSALRKKGYLLPPVNSAQNISGRWLSEKGRRAAEFLENNPQLD